MVKHYLKKCYSLSGPVGCSSLECLSPGAILDQILQITEAFNIQTHCSDLAVILKLNNFSFKKVWLFLGLVFMGMNLSAQDYSNQLRALEKSFTEKDVKYIEGHISPMFKFDTLPAANTIPLLEGLLGQFSKVKGISVSEIGQGKVLAEFHFSGSKIKSAIFFDGMDRITGIDFLEEIVQEHLADQLRNRKSLMGPSPDKLNSSFSPKRVEIKSKDGLIITGNLYEVSKTAPVILLCHQAGFNKFEYADIAPRLNELGFNCLAIDQRSGGTFAGELNETNKQAKILGIEELNYLDAQPDIEVALDYLWEAYEKEIILWGSSYSASLAFYIGASNDKVKGIISFSPGNYFGNKREPLENLFSQLNKPFFVTSSLTESVILNSLINDKTLDQNQVHFIPQDHGLHGSRILWTGQEGAEEYWSSITSFLEVFEN